MADTKVIILAAGKGTRMKAAVPKPLVEIAGKPMIMHLLERVEQANLNSKPIVIVAPDGKDDFEKVLGDRVELAIQREQKGTGDALKAAESLCEGVKRIVVLYGDHPFISPEVLQSLVDLVKDADTVAMLTAKVPNFEGDYSIFARWGRILRDEAGNIQGNREAKDASEAELAITEVNPSLYAFPAPWVWSALAKLQNNNASGEYYLTDLVGIATEEGKHIVSASVDPLEVVGVNTPEELKKAEALFTKNV